MLDKTINELRKNIREVPKKFTSIPEEKVSFKPSSNKWSKKEILGHLCDSAINNYSRFIRAQFEAEPMDCRTYSQNEWVALNKYKDITVPELLSLWTSLNNQIANIMSNVPDERMGFKCKYGEDIHTLKWLLEDYVNHMNHHLGQIFD